MRISSCIITKNEENNIARCINSLSTISNEIIVVDTGSEDKTIDICNKLGVIVFNYKWKEDFGAAKNFALSKAKGDWIIFLDADEYIEENSIVKIKNILQSREIDAFNALACKMINIDECNGKIINEVMKVRIFKNKEIFYEGSVHEHLVSKFGKINVVNKYKDIIIYHTGYSSDISETKAKRNLKMLLSELNNSEEDKKYYAYLSNCYFGLQDYRNAIKYAKLHINSGLIITSLESGVYKNLIDSLYHINSSNEEIEIEIKNAINKFPQSPNFYCAYANFFLYNKQYKRALEYFMLTLEYNENYNDVDINLVNGIINKIYIKIAQIYELKNNAHKALDYYFKSLKVYKYEKEPFILVCDLLKNEEAEDVIIFLNKIYDVYNEEDLRFLSYNFTNTGLVNVFNYYALKYLKNNEDITIKIYLLLLNNKYVELFEKLINSYKNNYNFNTALLLTIVVILINKKEYTEKIINITKPSLRRILSLYCLSRDEKLIKEDLNDYIFILEKLINVGNRGVLDKYIALEDNFEVDISIRLVSTFKNHSMYNEGVRELKLSLIHSDSANTYMGIGYCYYKLKDYSNAKISFQKSIEKGYKENDIQEFLNWIKEFE